MGVKKDYTLLFCFQEPLKDYGTTKRWRHWRILVIAELESFDRLIDFSSIFFYYFKCIVSLFLIFFFFWVLVQQIIGMCLFHISKNIFWVKIYTLTFTESSFVNTVYVFICSSYALQGQYY